MTTSVSLQIPILFDVSAAGVVFGEDVSGVDIFDAHLKFELDNDTAATVLANKFKDILFADASENDVSGVLFYYNVDRDTTAFLEPMVQKLFRVLSSMEN